MKVAMRVAAKRRGGAYVMVLVISALVTVLGVGGLLVRGRALETAGVRDDAAGARALSVSAVQLALESIADGAAVDEVKEVGNWIDEGVGTGTARARVVAEPSGDVVTVRGEGSVGAARSLLDVDVMHRADYRERALYLRPGGHWPLDETAAAAFLGAQDAVGDSDGAYANVITGPAGKFTGPDAGAAPWMDDDTDLVGVGERPWMVTAEATFAAWVYPPDKTGAAMAFAKGATPGTLGTVQVDIRDGEAALCVRTAIGLAKIDAPIDTETWVHLAVTIGASGLRLYIDGVLEASEAAEVTAVGAAGEPFLMGGLFTPTNGRYSDSLEGSLREVSFFTRELTAGEIAWMYGDDGAWEVDLEPPVVVAGSYRWAVE